jgi:hypothetical protein
MQSSRRSLLFIQVQAPSVLLSDGALVAGCTIKASVDEGLVALMVRKS